MFGFETAATALSTLYMVAGLAACPSPQKVDVDVKLVVKESPYITNVTATQMTQMFQADPDATTSTDGKWMTVGLTKSNLSGQFSANFYSHTNTKTKEACLAVDKVDYVITYTPLVYVASDYKKLGCSYSVTLAHEKRHVNTDKRVIDQFIPDMKNEIQRLVKKMPAQGPYPAAQVQAQQQRILAEVSAVTQPYMDQLIAKRRVEQAKIDTIENYMKETSLCPGQFPNFDGSK